MRTYAKAVLFLSSLAFVAVVFLFCFQASAQTSSSGTLQGVVTDQTNAVVPGATVEIHNPVSGYSRTATTDAAGKFTFSNVPFNPYHLTVTSKGFGKLTSAYEYRTSGRAGQGITNLKNAGKVGEGDQRLGVECR